MAHEDMISRLKEEASFPQAPEHQMESIRADAIASARLDHDREISVLEERHAVEMMRLELKMKEMSQANNTISLRSSTPSEGTPEHP